MTDREHIQTLLTVARRYWLEQATQAEIAAEIGYSRSMVSRLLDEARRRGIITFTVQHPLERAIELEDALTRTFGLTCARVAMSNDNATADEVARMAADLVTTYMYPDSVIALSNGRGGGVSCACDDADTPSGGHGGAGYWWDSQGKFVVGLSRVVPSASRTNRVCIPGDAGSGAGVESSGSGRVEGRGVSGYDDRDGLSRRHLGDRRRNSRNAFGGADLRPRDVGARTHRVVVTRGRRTHLRASRRYPGSSH